MKIFDYGMYANHINVYCTSKNISNLINSVYVNEAEKIVVVKWLDNTTTKVKCCEGDNFDLYTGVAIALCKKMFGSKNKFKNKIDSVVKYMNK